MYISNVKKNAEKPLKQEILAVARNMMLKDGYVNMSMRRLASEIGYSPTTLYNYFKNKDDILFNLCDEVYARIADMLSKVIDSRLSPEDNLKSCMLTYGRFGLENLDSYRIAFMIPVGDKNILSFLEKGAHGMLAYGMIRDIAAQLTDDADIAAQTAWSLMHGIVSHMIMHPHFPWVDIEHLMNFAADTLISGFAGGKK